MVADICGNTTSAGALVNGGTTSGLASATSMPRLTSPSLSTAAAASLVAPGCATVGKCNGLPAAAAAAASAAAWGWRGIPPAASIAISAVVPRSWSPALFLPAIRRLRDSLALAALHRMEPPTQAQYPSHFGHALPRCSHKCAMPACRYR